MLVLSGSFQFRAQDSGRGFQSPGSVLMDVMGKEGCALPATFPWILGDQFGEISILSSTVFAVLVGETSVALCFHPFPIHSAALPVLPVPLAPGTPFLLRLLL